jgi:hypothetical protein
MERRFAKYTPYDESARKEDESGKPQFSAPGGRATAQKLFLVSSSSEMVMDSRLNFLSSSLSGQLSLLLPDSTAAVVVVRS